MHIVQFFDTGLRFAHFGAQRQKSIAADAFGLGRLGGFLVRRLGLEQKAAIGAEIFVVGFDRAARDKPQPIRHQFQQVHIVADQNDGPGIGGERFDQGLSAFDVEVVRRFVEDQHMWRVKRGQQQRKPRLLPARQLTNRRFCLFGHQTKSRQTRAPFRRCFVRPFAPQVIKRRVLYHKLVNLMLGKIADAQFGGFGKTPAHQVQPVRQKLGQCRFALAVFAQQGDAVILVNAQVHPPQDLGALIAGRAALDIDNGGREVFWVGKFKAPQCSLLRRGDGLQLGQHLDPRLRLPRLVRLVPKAVHVRLKMRAAGLLLFRHCLIQSKAFGPLAGELIVRALVEGQLAIFEMQDRRDRPVQKAAVVTDDQNRVRVFGQIAFQPKRAFEVEIVCRLVQQQQIRLCKKHRGQGNAHPPATRKGRTGHRVFRIVKAQTFEDRGGTRLGGPGINIAEARLNLGDAVGVVGLLGQQCGAFRVRGQHRIKKRHLGGGDLLGDTADPGAFWQDDIA